MADNSTDRSELQTFTRDQYDKDPASVVKATKRGPVEVVDNETKKRVMYLTRPGSEPTQAAAE